MPSDPFLPRLAPPSRSSTNSDRPPSYKTRRAPSITSSTQAIVTPLPDSSSDSGFREPLRRTGRERKGEKCGERGLGSSASNAVRSYSDASDAEDAEGNPFVPTQLGSNQFASEEAMSRFYDSISATHTRLSDLKTLFDSLRALSARIHVLPSNDLSIVPLSTELRTDLLRSSSLMREINEDLRRIVSGEAEFREAGAVELGEEEWREREEEVEEVLGRWRRRVREIRREGREIRRERRVREEPAGVENWIDEGREKSWGFQSGLERAARWVVANPFTILARRTKRMRSLNEVSLEPSKSKSSKSSSTSHRPLLPPPPPSSRPFSWNFFPKKKHPSHPTLEKDLHELDQDIEEGRREMKSVARFGNRERWLVFLTLALIPSLLAFVFVEDQLVVFDLPETAGGTMVEGSAAAGATSWGGEGH